MDLVPVLLFLLALATIYVGSVETAFTLLMRLSLRFVADRGGPEDRLARYLDDPVKLFVPIRLMLGVLFACATILLAILIGRGGWRSIAALILSVAVFSLVCEHLLPTFLVRPRSAEGARDPAAVVRPDRALPAAAEHRGGIRRHRPPLHRRSSPRRESRRGTREENRRRSRRRMRRKRRQPTHR